MDNLLAMRVPAAVLALLILGLRIVAAILGTIAYSGDGPRGFALSAGEFSYRTIDPALVIVLVLLVLASVVVHPVRPARTLARAGAVVVGLSILVSLGLAVLGAAQGGASVGLDTLDTVLLLVVPLLGFVALLRLAALAPAPRGAGPEATPALTTGDTTDQSPPPEPPDPAQQPTWQPDVAAGAAWNTAGDAAAGAPASGWGTPGEAADWAPRSPEAGDAAEVAAPRAAERDADTSQENPPVEHPWGRSPTE